MAAAVALAVDEWMWMVRGKKIVVSPVQRVCGEFKGGEERCEDGKGGGGERKG